MYNITRQEAAETLGISTRSIDRYIKAGKLRSQKQGKIIYIHKWDIDTLNGDSSSRQEVIIPKKEETNSTQNATQESTTSVSAEVWAQSRAIEKIYLDLRNEIQKKDATIQQLSVELGQAREIAKNSVSLIEFKKSQFLLEESKTHLNKEMEDLETETQELKKELKYEKGTNFLLIAFVVVLLGTLAFVWFIKI